MKEAVRRLARIMMTILSTPCSSTLPSSSSSQLTGSSCASSSHMSTSMLTVLSAVPSASVMTTSLHARNSSWGPQPTLPVPFRQVPKHIDLL